MATAACAGTNVKAFNNTNTEIPKELKLDTANLKIDANYTAYVRLELVNIEGKDYSTIEKRLEYCKDCNESGVAKSILEKVKHNENITKTQKLTLFAKFGNPEDIQAQLPTDNTEKTKMLLDGKIYAELKEAGIEEPILAEVLKGCNPEQKMVIYVSADRVRLKNAVTTLNRSNKESKTENEKGLQNLIKNIKDDFESKKIDLTGERSETNNVTPEQYLETVLSEKDNPDDGIYITARNNNNHYQLLKGLEDRAFISNEDVKIPGFFSPDRYLDDFKQSLDADKTMDNEQILKHLQELTNIMKVNEKVNEGEANNAVSAFVDHYKEPLKKKNLNIKNTGSIGAGSISIKLTSTKESKKKGNSPPPKPTSIQIYNKKTSVGEASDIAKKLNEAINPTGNLKKVGT